MLTSFQKILFLPKFVATDAIDGAAKAGIDGQAHPGEGGEDHAPVGGGVAPLLHPNLFVLDEGALVDLIDEPHEVAHQKQACQSQQNATFSCFLRL